MLDLLALSDEAAAGIVELDVLDSKIREAVADSSNMGPALELMHNASTLALSMAQHNTSSAEKMYAIRQVRVSC